MKKKIIQLINIIPLGIVYPLQTINVLNSKKDEKYLTVPSKYSNRFS